MRFEPVNDEYEITVPSDRLGSETNMLTQRGLSEFQEEPEKEKVVMT